MECDFHALCDSTELCHLCFQHVEGSVLILMLNTANAYARATGEQNRDRRHCPANPGFHSQGKTQEQLNEKIKPVGVLRFRGTSCLCTGGHIHVNTCTVFSLFSPRTPNLGYSFETNSGNPFHYFTYGVACSEVEIDCLTGDHKVRSGQNFGLKGEKTRNN